MRFCSGCGKTISILNDSDAELCKTCRPGNSTVLPTQQNSGVCSDLLSTTIRVEDGKILLESREGWLLWSGDCTAKHTFESMTSRAGRILTIRNKQKKQ